MPMTPDGFIIAMEQNISAKAAEIIASKPEKEKFLNYVDVKQLTLHVKNICNNHFNEVPKQVEVACNMAEMVVAPMDEKIKLLRKAIAISGGVGGLAAIITAIGMALGWGMGPIAALIAFFTAASPLPAVALAAAGAVIAALAGYFMFYCNEVDLSNKALKALHDGVSAALKEYLKENADKLHD